MPVPMRRSVACWTSAGALVASLLASAPAVPLPPIGEPAAIPAAANDPEPIGPMATAIRALLVADNADRLFTGLTLAERQGLQTYYSERNWSPVFFETGTVLNNFRITS